VLLSLIVVYVSAKLGGELCARVNLSPVLGELVGGVLVGVSALHLIVFPEAGGVPVFSEFRKARNQLVADFKDLPDIQYMVVVEGRAKKKASLPKRRTS
jgi:hypothetical protein